MNGDLRLAYRASREGPRDIVFHSQFVHVMTSAASAYAAAEAANVVPLQAIPQPLETVVQEALGVINFPTELLLGPR